MGWDELYREARPSPLGADPATFAAAAADASRAAATAREVSTRFDQLTSGLDAPVEGAAATALATMVGQVSAEVEALAPVFEDLADIFDDHARDLEQFRQNAADGLGRAWAAHRELQEAVASRNDGATAVANAQESVGSAQANVSWLRDQIDEVAALPEAALSIGELESRLDHWEGELADRRGALSHARSALVNAEHRVDEAEGQKRRWFEDRALWPSYASLREAEHELNERTAARIRALDLGVLGDPSTIEQLTRTIAELGDFVTGGWIDATLDWIRENGPLLDEIRQLTKKFAAWIGTAALVLSIVPGLQGLAGALQLVSLGLTAAAFVITVAMASAGATGMDGQRVGFGDVLKDGVMLGVAMIGFKGARADANSLGRAFSGNWAAGGTSRVFQAQRADALRFGKGDFIVTKLTGAADNAPYERIGTAYGNVNDLYSRTFGAKNGEQHVIGGDNITDDLIDVVTKGVKKVDLGRLVPTSASPADAVRSMTSAAKAPPTFDGPNTVMISDLGLAA